MRRDDLLLTAVVACGLTGSLTIGGLGWFYLTGVALIFIVFASLDGPGESPQTTLDDFSAGDSR